VSSHRLIETRSIDYIPLSERHGRVWHLWPIWFTGDAQLATLASGVIGIAGGLNVLWSAAAILGGSALGTFFMAFHSTQGPQLGLPQMIQSRPQFGAMGALLVWCVALVTYIGFNAFNQLLAGQALHELAGLPPAYGIVLFTLAAVLLACIGYDWIHYAQRGLAGLMLVALTIFTLRIGHLPHLPPAQFSPRAFKAIPFLAQFFAAASYQLSWSIYVSDYSRYLPRHIGVAAAFWWTFLGAMIGGSWMMIVGLAISACFPGADIAQAVLAAGNAILPHFGPILLLSSLGGLISITGLNLYGASLTFLSIADSIAPLRPTAGKRLAAIGLACVIASLIALRASGDFVNRFGDLLSLLLYLFTPWTAINLVDFYIIRKGHYSIREIFNRNGMYGRWNWRGLCAYAAGFAAMIPFFSTGLYTGPIAHRLGGADLAMLVGLPVAALVYIWACGGMDLVEDRRRAEAADVGLV
jgi:purine-cytosine permease-like protein